MYEEDCMKNFVWKSSVNHSENTQNNIIDLEKKKILLLIKKKIETLRFNVPSEIPAVFHNNWNYDYHFLIKELDKEYQGKVECLGENTGKYIKFSDGNENVATISYK